jgi:hypothetical protein
MREPLPEPEHSGLNVDIQSDELVVFSVRGCIEEKEVQPPSSMKSRDKKNKRAGWSLASLDL